MRSAKLWMLTLILTLTACAPATFQPTNTAIPPTVVPPTSAPVTPEVPPTEISAIPTLEPTFPAPTLEPTVQPTPAVPLITGVFINGEVSVSGSYTLDPASNTLRLSEDFRVDSGPDLYVALSAVGDLTLHWQTFSKRATEAPLLRLGQLASFSGAQTYPIPADADLSQYQSVLIWCNTYSVEFAVAPLAP